MGIIRLQLIYKLQLMTTYCYPVPHGKQHFESKEKAEEHTFDTRADVDRWIQKQNNPGDWVRACCNNVIGVDQNGNLSKNQEYTPRKPGEQFEFVKDLGKPDFEYFV
jgi:hypothetical protein